MQAAEVVSVAGRKSRLRRGRVHSVSDPTGCVYPIATCGNAGVSAAPLLRANVLPNLEELRGKTAESADVPAAIDTDGLAGREIRLQQENYRPRDLVAPSPLAERRRLFDRFVLVV